MGKEDNLIPAAHKLTVEEASKGGKASGKARKEKADLRKMAQALLDGRFTDVNGISFTGSELVQKGLMQNLADAGGRNWGKAMDILITLTGASITPEQKEAMKAQTEKVKAETKRLNADEKQENNGKLSELIAGLKENDIYTETAAVNADVAREPAEAPESP